METNRKKDWNPETRFQQNNEAPFEASSKTGYTVSMAWEIKQ